VKAPAHIFQPPADSLEIIFAEEFTKLQGKFAFCLNEEDLHLQLQQLITAKDWAKIYCSEDKWNLQFQQYHQSCRMRCGYYLAAKSW
jgi:L-lactate dehydrogenase complex protein LldG